MAEPGGNSRLLSRLAWSIFGLLALLVFELTADPALAACVLSTKFGWKNVLTANWLRKRDPARGRGLACFWFELMIGALKILIGTFASSVAIVATFVVWLGNNKGARAPAWVDQLLTAWFSGAFTVLGVTVISLGLLGCAGCVFARRHRVKVWISPSLHAMRRADQWPPLVADTNNMAGFAAAMALIANCSVIGYVVFNSIQRLHLSPYLFSPLFLPPCLFMCWLFRGIKLENVASTPGECWTVGPSL